MYKRREIKYNELIELFATRTINELKSGDECPKINIILEQDGFDLLKEVQANPFNLKGYWIPNITDSDIEKFLYENNCNENNLAIYIKNSRKFFGLLTQITNKSLFLYYSYWGLISEREYCLNILRRIWLRMGPNDFNDVNKFLEKQLDFLNNNWNFDWNGKNYQVVDNFFEREVLAYYSVSGTYDETFYEVEFRIKGIGETELTHTLSTVRYGMCYEENELVCYIYAIQNTGHHYINKVVQRQLYKQFAKQDYGVHPKQIYAMYLFLKQLQKSGITKVKIPILQVLNYNYHEIMYDQEEDVIEQCDKISKLKTEKLLMVMEVMQKLFEDFTLLNDLDTVSDTWNYCFENKKNNEKILLKENR